MSLGVAVLGAGGITAGSVPGAEVELIECLTGAEFVRALGGWAGPAVLLSDGLADADLAVVGAATKARGAPVIEVRSGRWDGETQSPVSAACRGVISGFGVAGIAAAVALLVREAARKQ